MPGLLALAVLLLGILATPPVPAAVEPTIDARLQSICTHDPTQHPRRAELTTIVDDDRFDALDRVLLLALYQPHPATRGEPGRLSVRATLLRADGTRQRLGNLRGRQAAANAPLLVSRTTEVPLAAGDRIEWSFKLRGFADLVSLCFNLAAGVGPDE